MVALIDLLSKFLVVTQESIRYSAKVSYRSSDSSVPRDVYFIFKVIKTIKTNWSHFKGVPNLNPQRTALIEERSICRNEIISGAEAFVFFLCEASVLLNTAA